MKIQHALLSCNTDPRYLDFWRIALRGWRRLGIEPKLMIIRDGDEADDIDDAAVRMVEPLPDVPLSVQATWGRFWLATRYPNAAVIVADIDMLPLSARFFVARLAPVGDDKYVHMPYHPDYFTMNGRRPVCYHIARGAVMQRALDIPDDWREACRRVTPWYKQARRWQRQCRAGTHWLGDELYTSARLRELAIQEPRMLMEIDTAEDPRIDREAWLYDAHLLRAGGYRDANLPRPYARHKMAIDRLATRRAMPPALAPCMRLALRCKAFCQAPPRRPGGRAAAKIALWTARRTLAICAHLSRYAPLRLAMNPLLAARRGDIAADADDQATGAAAKTGEGKP